MNFRITNPADGSSYDILNDPAWTQPDGASRLAVTLGWSTSDYTNTGNNGAAPPDDDSNANTVSINALGSAIPNGDGSFRVTSPVAIPDGNLAPGVRATGSGVTVLGADDKAGIAEIIGDAMQKVQRRYGAGLTAMNESSLSSIMVGGQ